VAGDPTDDEPNRDRWRRVRRRTAIAYVAVLVWIVVTEGVPTGRTSLMTIVVVGLAITALGHGWRRLLQVLLDWLPFTLVLLVYDLSRHLATAVDMPVHESDIASAEKWTFGGTVPTVWLQQHFYTPASVHWYDALATLVYTSHFLTTPILAAVLWLGNRAVWISYIRRVIALSFAGLVTYVLFPEAPPWLAARDGLIDPVHRLSARGWIWLRLGDVEDLLDNAQKDGSNPVAAMPSLHTAFAVLAALFVATRLADRWRYLLALYPVAMGLVLVYTGEHYVLDLVAGVAYAFGVHSLVSRWERCRTVSTASREREVVAVG
jgi:membrane-associated phospholipid phosphatase